MVSPNFLCRFHTAHTGDGKIRMRSRPNNFQLLHHARQESVPGKSGTRWAVKYTMVVILNDMLA